MMTDVHVAILSKPLHICENLPPALHLVSLVRCVPGGELPQLSSCQQNHVHHMVGWAGGAMVAGTCAHPAISGAWVVCCEPLVQVSQVQSAWLDCVQIRYDEAGGFRGLVVVLFFGERECWL